MKATPPTTCDACHTGVAKLEPAVIVGIQIWRCVLPSPCLARARRARIGMWAR
jgi:hypothetical protein